MLLVNVNLAAHRLQTISLLVQKSFKCLLHSPASLTLCTTGRALVVGGGGVVVEAVVGVGVVVVVVVGSGVVVVGSGAVVVGGSIVVSF